MYDVVTIGEGMLRLSPPGHGRLRRARSLDLHVCGSQGNVACNLARLGLRTAFVTQVPDHALGLVLRDFYQSCGVNVSHVRPIPNSRIGVNFIEFGATPRASAAVYDRAHSAASMMTPEDFPWDEILAGTRLAYTDGILPGLSGSCRETARAFVSAARRHGCLVAFDVNYRAHLWSPSQAAEVLAGVVEQVDVLITTRGDAETVFGCRGAGEEIARQLHERFGCQIIGVTLGGVYSVLRGSVDSILWHAGTVYRGRAYDVDAVDRFGAGDAWGAGLIYGYLARGDLQYAVEFANAMCAADFTISGDVAHVTAGEIEAIMNSRDYRVTR